MSQRLNPARAATVLIGMGLALAGIAMPTRASAQYPYACPPGYYYHGIYGCVPASYYYGLPYYPYPGFDSVRFMAADGVVAIAVAPSPLTKCRAWRRRRPRW